ADIIVGRFRRFSGRRKSSTGAGKTLSARLESLPYSAAIHHNRACSVGREWVLLRQRRSEVIRHRKIKRRTLSDVALRTDAPAVTRHDALHDRQPDAGALEFAR